MRNTVSNKDRVIERNFQSNENCGRTHQTHGSDQERYYQDPLKEITKDSLCKPFWPKKDVPEEILD
jgi:hypothetical protein